MPRRPKLTAKERKAYRGWAEKELVGLFLEAMEQWNQTASAGRKSFTGGWEAPLPCNPRLTDSDICISPFPPWPPKQAVVPVPDARWPQIVLQFKIDP
jgi:hypothetical protein